MANLIWGRAENPNFKVLESLALAEQDLDKKYQDALWGPSVLSALNPKWTKWTVNVDLAAAYSSATSNRLAAPDSSIAPDAHKDEEKGWF